LNPQHKKAFEKLNEVFFKVNKPKKKLKWKGSMAEKYFGSRLD